MPSASVTVSSQALQRFLYKMRSLNETTQLIRDEHKKLRGLMRQLEGLESREPEFYRGVVRELCLEVQVYIELEERVLFPRLHAEYQKKFGDGETPATEYIHQCLTDHREIFEQIRAVRLRLQRPTELRQDFIDQVDELRSLVESHMNGDEQKLLPLMEKGFPRLDAELSMKWFDVGDEIRARIGMRSPSDPGHAQNPKGGEQGRKAS